METRRFSSANLSDSEIISFAKFYSQIIQKICKIPAGKSAKYSENHKDVGIVFASLVNFNELYDESYMGGKVRSRSTNKKYFFV